MLFYFENRSYIFYLDIFMPEYDRKCNQLSTRRKKSKSMFNKLKATMNKYAKNQSGYLLEHYKRLLTTIRYRSNIIGCANLVMLLDRHI